MENSIKIKVCGMRDEQNILKVASLAPDYMGFIHYAPSPRFVGENFSIPEVSSSIRKVGVFVNESTAKIMAQASRLGLEYIQLHGTEPPEHVAALHDQGLKVIKVFSVDDHFNFRATKPYVNVADLFLFDTKGKHFGGNAENFDWGILRHYDQEVPFFLSGGLSSENIAGISGLKYMNLHGLDLNSGVEESPAMKDIEKLRSFLTAMNIHLTS